MARSAERTAIGTTVPLALRGRIIAAACAQRGWAEDSGIPQETFFRQVLRAYCYDLLAAHEIAVAREAAAEAKRRQLLDEIGDIGEE